MNKKKTVIIAALFVVVACLAVVGCYLFNGRDGRTPAINNSAVPSTEVQINTDDSSEGNSEAVSAESSESSDSEVAASSDAESSTARQSEKKTAAKEPVGSESAAAKTVSEKENETSAEDHETSNSDSTATSGGNNANASGSSASQNASGAANGSNSSASSNNASASSSSDNRGNDSQSSSGSNSDESYYDFWDPTAPWWQDLQYDEESSSNQESSQSTTPHTHSYTKTVTAPTCKDQGYTTYTCSCGDSYTSDYVPATGHQMGPEVDFFGDGYTYVSTCSVCGATVTRNAKMETVEYWWDESYDREGNRYYQEFATYDEMEEYANNIRAYIPTFSWGHWGNDYRSVFVEWEYFYSENY